MKKSSSISKAISWGLYDFANSGYYLVYVLLTFPLFLANGPFKTDVYLETKWGFAQGFSVLIAVLIGLIVGKTLDKIGMLKVVRYFIVLPAILSFLFPLLIYLNCNGYILLSCYVIVQSTYLVSLTIYDASLTHITSGNETIKISSWAWGWGYIGGLLCMGLMQIGLLWWSEFSPFEFVIGSSFYLLFSVFAVVKLIRQIKKYSRPDFISQDNLKDDSENFYKLKIKKPLLLVYFLFIIDGIAIFFAFFTIYASREANLSNSDITLMLAVMQLLAFPLTGLVSIFTYKKPINHLVLCGISWTIAILLVFISPSKTSIWISVIIVAATVGSTQALIRAIYAHSVTKPTAIMGFSIYSVVEKGAAFIGPVLAGFVLIYIGYSFVILIACVSILIGITALIISFYKQKKQVTDG